MNQYLQQKKKAAVRLIQAALISSSLIVNGQSQTENEPDLPSTFIKYLGHSGKSRGVTAEQTEDDGYILTGYTTAGAYGNEDVLFIKTNAYGEVQWMNTYGGEGEDAGWAIRQCGDGGYIITGFTDSFGQGNMDIYLLKTDSNGALEWSKTFGGEDEEYGWDVQVTGDGGFIIAAQTNSFGNGEIDAYLVKVDENGAEQWSKTYGGSKTDRIFSVQEDPAGGYVAAGITYSYSSVNSTDRDGYVVKTDVQGNERWSKTYGGDRYDVVHSISSTEDQGYILTGYGESFAEHGKMDLYLIKIGPSGTARWTSAFGGAESQRGIKGEQTGDGGFVAIGFDEKDRNAYLVKSDSEGSEEWTRSFGSTDKVDFGYTVTQTRDGGYLLVGHSEDLSGSSGKVLLIKTNDAGLIE